jgi:small subunit ribosomal protein S9
MGLAPALRLARRLGARLGDVRFAFSPNAAGAVIDHACARGFGTSAPSEDADKSRVDTKTPDWQEAMDAGQWDVAWERLHGQAQALESSVPTLEDVLDWDPDDEEKQIRRRKELEYQDQQAKSRVRAVSEQGIAHGVGRRKTAVSRVWLREGSGHIMVNKKPFDMYFPDILRRNDVLTPLVVADSLGKFDVAAIVEGGGVMAQAQACRHGIAKALQHWEPELRGVLKENGLLSRDARIVERKKPGRRKARASWPWVKR